MSGNCPAATPGRRVVIVGGGFGGLFCARRLGGSAAQVTLVDRNNYNLFQPLLYQVATAALSPADIAEPIRTTLGRYPNISVIMGEVVGVEVEARRVQLADGATLAFDHLVLATGGAYTYYGRPEWAKHAPPLKCIADARRLRRRLLLAFEEAERTIDPREQARLTTSVVVGGGPTGVEMAGAIAELCRWTLARDFRRVRPADARVILVEAGPRLLANFPEALASYATERLRALGVEVITGQAVEAVSEGAVVVAGRTIACRTIVWGAGIVASPAAEWIGVNGDRAGRIPVDASLAVTGRPGIYAIGDTALVHDEDGQPLPALAQVAKQQGRHLGDALRRAIERGEAMPAFRFSDRGNTAIIGRNAAIYDYGRFRLKGRTAWLLWAVVHVYLLVSGEQRTLVSIQWLWRYFTYRRGARLII
jgi:NADH:ubiquinone reductase (H+-translocating)